MRTTTEGTTRPPQPAPSRQPPWPGRRRVPVDPRLRRRQIDVRRAEGRRRLRWLAAVVGVVVVVASAWGLTRSPLLDVNRVLVEGATHTPQDAIRAAAGTPPGRPMTEVDGSEAAARLAGLAWVQRAEVRREWPGTVRIRVTERIATIATRDGAGGWVLVDRTGRVLERATAPPPGMAM
ncbi:MAG: cell division protein FtsQ/DivIB, partial [Acidimicrobiales bacterium]